MRSVPFRTSTNPFSVPAFAAGRAVERTLGPFVDPTGRSVWVDLFRRTRQVSVVRAPETVPFLTVPLRGPLAPGTEYRLPAGSIWISARLLTPAAPQGGYCGIRIKGGVLKFSATPTIMAGVLQVPAGATVRIEIDPEVPASPTATGSLGPDGAAARATPPRHAEFVFAGASGSLAQAADATMTAFGTASTLEHLSQAPTFEPLVNRVLLPFKAESGLFRIKSAKSELFQPSGAADRVEGAWALPVTVAPPETLGAAAGAGGVAIRVAAGFRGNWRGLAAGPVELGPALVMAEPGRLVLAAESRPGTAAEQTLRLWRESEAQQDSVLILSYLRTAPLRFFSEADNADALQIDPFLEASLDRPVRVDGSRFPLRSDRVMAIFWQAAAGFFVFVAADLAPSPDLPWRGTRSLALRNGLLHLAGPLALIVAGSWTAPDQVVAGSSLVLFAVKDLIPALKDPYVTNFAPRPFRPDVSVAGADTSRPLAGLLAWVQWPDPKRPRLSLILLPAPGQTAAVALAPAETTNMAGETNATEDQELRVKVMAAEFKSFAGLPEKTGEEDRAAQTALRRVFEETAGPVRESLLLLDVSSNIDQFGIGFGLRLRDQTPTAAVLPLRIEDLDLSAPGRNLRVILLPQFQWEPVTNIPNPLLDPFPSRLGSADDGGRTALGTPSVTLVPIAPERLTEQMLAEFKPVPDGTPLAAHFTLPFGMIAAARFQPQGPDQPSWTTLDLVRPESPDGNFTGGLQLAAEAHPDLGADQESPSFPGAAWQTRNGIDPATLSPLGLSVLAESVAKPGAEAFFNGEMGPWGTNPRVPVKRIDFSGYGASMFSRWGNPHAIAEISQVRFDVVVGRTAYEVVQVSSILYPWAVPVVRTITLERRKEGAVLRFDTGWVAVGPGLYRYPLPQPADRPAGWTEIETHPGVVRGAWNVRRIRETGRVVTRSFPPEGGRPAVDVELLEARFDADFDLEGVGTGKGQDGLVPSIDQVGFVQRMPKGYPLFPEHLAAILDSEGPAGGPLDCVVDIASSGQQLQLARVDVAAAPPAFGGTPQFAAAARGALALPRDGDWSSVRHDLSIPEPQPVDQHAGVPLIRVGTASGTVPPSPSYRVAEPTDLLRENDPTVEFGLVQGSDGHRALFPRPRIQQGETKWSSTEKPKLADTYTLSLGVGVFPREDDCLVGEKSWGLDIGGDGRFTLLPTPKMRFLAPPGVADRRLVDAAAFKIRTRYQGDTHFTLDPTLPQPFEVIGDAILTTMDLGPFSELVGIKHGFRSAAGELPSFVDPEMVYPPLLQSVVEILEFLAKLLGVDNVLAITGFQGSFKFKATLNLPIENPKTPDKYFDFGGMEIKGKLQLGVASAPEWNGFMKIQLGARVPVVPPIMGGGEVSVELTGTALGEQTVKIEVKWSASVGKSLGPITVKGSFFFGIQVVVSTTGAWQIGLLVGISASADIWIAKITVKLEMLAAIKVLTPAEDPPSGSKQALGQAKFAAEVSVAWFLTVSVEYTLEYKEKLAI